MKVSIAGLLKNASAIMEGDQAKGYAYMLEEFLNNLRELGKRYREGDTAVVDEFLSLYCLDGE